MGTRRTMNGMITRRSSAPNRPQDPLRPRVFLEGRQQPGEARLAPGEHPRVDVEGQTTVVTSAGAVRRQLRAQGAVESTRRACWRCSRSGGARRTKPAAEAIVTMVPAPRADHVGQQGRVAQNSASVFTAKVL